MEQKYGTEPFKLHRTESVDTSVEAAHTVDSATWEQRMHEFVKRAGREGTTAKDALRQWSDAPYSTITARFAALKRKGLVVDTGLRIDRSAVLVSGEFAEYYEEINDEL